MSISKYLSDYVSSAKALLLSTLDEANELLKFSRVKSRDQQKVLCTGATPPDALLRKVFQLDDEKLSEDELFRLRKKFHKNCKSLINAYYDRAYYNKVKRAIVNTFGETNFFKLKWEGADTAFKMNAEIFVNLGFKAYELGGLSWSDWLLTTTEGQMLLDMIRSGTKQEKAYGLATLCTYLLTIYITSGYDDYLFRKEFIDIFPTIKSILPEGAIPKKVIAIASGKTILALVRAAIQRVSDTPDEFFDNWLIA